MASAFKKHLQRAAKHTHGVFSVPCTYYCHNGPTLRDIEITISNAEPARNPMQTVVSYEEQGTLQKSQMPDHPSPNDYFITDDGDEYGVELVTRETTVKWYFIVVRKN